MVERRVTIVTDAAADLPSYKILQERFGLREPLLQIPIGVDYDSKNYDTGNESEYEELIGLMRKSLITDKFPTTSAPNPEIVASICEGPIRRGSKVLIVGVGSSYSSAYESYQKTAEMFDAGQVIPIDTGAASMGEGILAINAEQMAQNGAGAEKIAESIKNNSRLISARVLVPNTRFLMKSGRVPGFREGESYYKYKGVATNLMEKISGILSVVPIIKIDNNEAGMDQLIRYRENNTQKFKRWIIDFVKGDGYDFVGLLDCDANKLRREVRQSLVGAGVPDEIIYEGNLGITAIHGGIESLAIIVKRKVNK